MEENKKIIQETCKRYQFLKKIMQVHITKKKITRGMDGNANIVQMGTCRSWQYH
jgi:hypothetical protein